MKDIADILQWYELAGVTETLADEPFNVLRGKQNNADIVQNVIPKSEVSEKLNVFRPATTLLAQESGAACINARERCYQAQNLEELRNIVEGFDGCSLKFSANSTVFGSGNSSAQVMVIGEAPGADEDRIGKPFVGRSGQLLEKMLAAIGLQRDDCFITNILPWRPPGNRTPTAEEVAVCLPFLMRQIELVSPKVIFLLGASAANAVLNNADSISSLRGRILEVSLSNGKKISALASYHPAYLLRNSAQKAKSWSDLMRLRRCIDGE